jgi:hypothetical protein
VGLAPNGSYTVIASKAGWKFNPQSYTYVNCTTDHSAGFAASPVGRGRVTTPDPVPRIIDWGGESCAGWASSGGNPIDSSVYFVVNHYLDFLGRGPDTAGLRFWANQIESCSADAQCREVQRINVSAAFYLSIEFQETGYLAYRLERASFGTTAGYRGLMADAGEVASGVQVGIGDWQARLASNRRAFADEWVRRDEFRAKFDSMTDEQFVSSVATNAGLTLDARQTNALVANLRAGTETRAGVLLKLADDAGFKGRETNRAFVLMQYFGYLRRDPDEGGYNFRLQKLEGFRSDFIKAEMVKAFISATEYRERFEQH